MISRAEQYHGSALLRILRALPRGAHLRVYSDDLNCAYVVNERGVLYVKHSSNRLTPWIFTVTREQSKEIFELQREFSHFFIGFVCNSDGIAILNALQLGEIIGDIPLDADAGVRVARPRRKMYSVSGPMGELSRKVEASILPDDFLSSLNR